MNCKLYFSCQAPKYLTVEYLHCGTTSAYDIIANESQTKINTNSVLVCELKHILNCD